MSASDKKQQRKAAMADSLTQREKKEQAEAQAAKRKKTAYIAVGVICAAAAAAVLVWNALGSANHNGAVAANVGGQDYKVEDLQYYYMSARNFVYTYAQYGLYSYDVNTGDGAQWYNEAEGKTYADYFRESALENLKQTAALCAAANEAGYTLSEAGQKQVEDELGQIDLTCARYGMSRNTFFKRQYGISEKAFVRNLTNDTLASEYAQYYKDNISYDDAALQAYYEEHTDTMDSYDYRSFTISGEPAVTLDDDGNPIETTDAEKEQAMTAAKVKAEQAVKEIEAAEDQEQAFIDAAPKYVSDTQKDAYAVASYSLSTEVLGSSLSSNGSAIASWLMESGRKKFDVTSIETSTGYQVVMFLDRKLVQDPTVNIRHILAMAETSEGAETNSSNTAIPTQEQMDAAKAKIQALMDQWNAMPAEEQTAENFGKLAEENSDDGGSNTNGGRYTYVREGTMVPNFNDWIFDPSRQSGDVGMVENSGDDATYYGWHLIYFEEKEEPYWKSVAIDAKQSNDQSEWVTGLTEAVTVAEADGMKYVGEANTAQPTPTESPAESADPDSGLPEEVTPSPAA